MIYHFVSQRGDYDEQSGLGFRVFRKMRFDLPFELESEMELAIFLWHGRIVPEDFN